MATNVRRRGWRWHGEQSTPYLSAYSANLEGLRLTPSSTGVDVMLLGDTPATNYLNYDASDGSVDFVGNSHINIQSFTGSNFIVAGTSASTCPSSSTADRFFDVQWSCSATSGEMEVGYFRAYVSGNGLESYALSGCSDVETGTTHATIVGTRGYVVFSSGTQVSGIARGIEGWVFMPNAAVTGGTYCGGTSGIWADGSSTSGGTIAIHRFEMGGNSTGITALGGYVFDFQGLNTTQFTTGTNDTIDHVLKIRVASTDYYIGLYDSPT